MSDIELATENLDGHSICLCKDGELLTDDGRGISPMMRLIAEGRDLIGYSAADVIVGKAAAMLFVKAGIAQVYGRTMSRAGKEYLEAHGIPCSCGELTEKIINRTGDDICPMERTVMNIDGYEEGYEAIKERLAQMKK